LISNLSVGHTLWKISLTLLKLSPSQSNESQLIIDNRYKCRWNFSSMTWILATDNRFLMKVENTLEYGWWAKTQTLLETLNVTNQDLYPNIYAIYTVLIMPVSLASSERSFSAIRRVKRLSLELQWVMRDYQIYHCYTSTEQEI
jgi:hypothetical protein